MTPPAARRVARGPVGVATAVAGATESTVAASLSGRRELVLVRRCADVAELVSVAEAGLVGVAVVGEAFPRLDLDVVDRLRRSGCAVLGVVDPDRESSERLRAWGLQVVEIQPGERPDPAPAETEQAGSALAVAVLAALDQADPDDRSASQAPASRVPPDEPGAAPGRGRPGRRSAEVQHAGAEPGHDEDGDAVGGGPPDGPDGPDAPDRGEGDEGRGEDEHEPDAPPETSVAPWEPEADAPGEPSPRRGRIVAVWGPAGAPGRTTVAVSVAAELAADGAQVLLVDADTYAASIAQVLGMLDESPGLVAAVRAGLDGRLHPAGLARLAPTVSPGLRVLTGLTRAARWSELRPAGLQVVLATARLLVDHVVVDLATPLEEDDELSYDTAAPRRNGTTLEVLRAADDVLVVGSADPVGLQRLVRGLQDLAAVLPGVAAQVVVNRLRADAVGRNPRLRVREALDRFAGVRDLRLVPDDRPATDRALLAGRTLAEAAPDSPARAALQAVARGLVPQAATATTRRARRGVVTRG